jgi:hypothetical protein
LEILQCFQTQEFKMSHSDNIFFSFESKPSKGSR